MSANSGGAFRAAEGLAERHGAAGSGAHRRRPQLLPPDPGRRRRPSIRPVPASEHSQRQAGLSHADQRRLLSGGIPLYSIA